ncbi:RNA polymerase sigma factor [Mycoplasmatota bacterium WC30]
MLIINDILNGEIDKFSILMERYHNELFKYIYNMTDDYHLTEDLLQEIFFRIYKNLIRYDAVKSSFRTWIYRITSNYVFNHFKSSQAKLKQKTYSYDDNINSSKEDVEGQAIKNQQINEILTAMKRLLKPKHFSIMSLHFFSNLTVKEISKSMEIPEKTIYKAIKTSTEKIKKEVALNDEV